MKKKICFFIYDLRTGGAEKIVSEISNELSKSFNITILTVSNENKFDFIIDKNVNIQTLGVKKISNSIMPLFFFLKKNKFDYFIANIWPLTIISSFLCLFFKNTKSIIIEHSILSDQFLLNSNFIVKYLKYISVFIFYNLLNKIIAVSITTKEDLVKIGVNRKKIHVIYNFIKTNNNLINKNLFKKYETKQKIVKLLNIGIFKKIKNQSFLIDVADILLNKYNLNFILIILGKGPLKRKLKEKIKSLKLENNVKLLENTNDTYGTLKSCDMYLSSSISESFGLTVLEALVLNKKIVISEIKISHEIILSEHKDFISQLDKELFAKKIIDLLNTDFKKYDNLYQTKFNYEKSINSYKKLFN
jgi:hypothetical protein